MFSSVFGLLFFLIFMLFATQVIWSLYATSVVTGAAYDAGRLAARTGDAVSATAQFDRSIGTYDAEVTIDAPVGEGTVTVTLTGANPSLLPERFATVLPFGRIDRTIEVRREVFVADVD